MNRGYRAAGAVLGMALAFVVAPTASAAPEYQLVSVTSGPGTTGNEVVVGCPDGKKVYSVGARLNDSPPGSAVVQRVEPTPDLSRVVVVASGSGGQVGWSLTGFALCGPGEPVLRGSDISAAQVVHSTSEAGCAPGETVTGVGAKVSGDQTGLYAQYPQPGLTKTAASAFGPVGGSWQVEAWAICAVLPFDVELVVGSTGQPGFSQQTATATCPAGTSLLGWGGAVVGPQFDEPATLISTTPDGNQVTAIGTTDGASPWGMRAHAICRKN